MTDIPRITFRPIRTRAECDECVALQREIWGRDFTDVVPPAILLVSQRVGGVAIGAFDPAGTLLGFVFGLSGVRDGQLAHWSDLLAVRPDARGHGLGFRLKTQQREQLVRDGVDVVSWSFDPLVARNAHLNLNRLGAVPVEYVVDMYGNTGSGLHQGGATDRLIVEWRLRDPHVETVLAGHPRAGPDILDNEESGPAPLAKPPSVNDPSHGTLPTGASVRIAVPAVRTSSMLSPSDARRWRMFTRQAFQHYLERGFRVVGFTAPRDGDLAWYTLRSTP